MLNPFPMLLGGVLLAVSAGDDGKGKVDYAAEVKPILELFCYECHGPIDANAGLRLDSYPAILKGSEAGPIVEKGKAAESFLIDVLEGAEGDRMPPEGPAVPAEDIALIRKWIDEGAVGPEDEKPIDPAAHWSFRTPTRPDVPGADWGRNPIDAFLAIGHAKAGVTPAPEADRATLLRRVSLDLTGLAPTRGELHAFLDDPARDAYERAVDRLLDSPAYGERWGRHWMDVWRYSDWSGFGQEVRISQPHIWRWRDWIVENLNRDRPYDEMVVAMLAADEAAPGDEDDLRATGYLARSWYKFNRNVWLDETVEHAGKAFLGLTFNCAKCHDHKYDPIAQADFYKLRAVFEPHQVRTDELGGGQGLVRVYDDAAGAPTFLFEKGDEAMPVKDRPLAPGLPVLFVHDLAPEPVALPAREYYPGLRPEIRDRLLAKADEAARDADQAAARAREGVAEIRRVVDALAAGGKAPEPESAVDEATRWLADDFRARRGDLWEVGPGEWAYGEMGLVQSRDGMAQHELVSLGDHPADFRAEFRFRITGGSTYRSVGLSFDRQGPDNDRSVYLSAHGPGPKIQVAARKPGAEPYPAAGMRALPIEVGRAYTLRVTVRGNRLNAHLDGKLVLVCDLQGERTPGKLSVWAFDATAEFLGFAAGPISEGEDLAATTKAEEPYSPPPATLAEARGALSKAERGAGLAEVVAREARAERESVRARAAADAAKYAENPDAAEAEKLGREAAAAEREAALAKAEGDLARAEAGLAELRDAAQPDAMKLAEAEKKVAGAKEALGKTREAGGKAVYSPLTEVYPAESTGRRLALARWITSAGNPLAARVAVNQIWMRHFGTPLVSTVFDLGRNGKAPTHPELLDWLAVELVESGWSMKHLHRLMVSSAAYRMRSAGVPNDPNAEADPSNASYWRMNPRRMEGELVRDNVLRAAGALDETFGGPELDEKADEATARRSLYYRHAAEKQSLFLKLFDAPNVNACYRRDESVVPQQALALANSALVQRHAIRLAEGLGEGNSEDGEFVVAAFETVVGRGPSGEEKTMCLEYLEGQGKGEGGARKAREGLVKVLFNHNDFVTIR